MFLTHETSITNTELENMIKAKTIATVLEKLDVFCIRPSIGRVTVWLVKGIDQTTNDYRNIVVSTVTSETRLATRDELANGVSEF